MDLYFFDAETGEYVGTRKAQPNPKRPGEYLTDGPCRTTTPPPETGPREVAVFDAPGWIVQPDFRGVTYWTADGAQATIGGIGIEPPEGALTAPPEPPAPPEYLTAPQFEYLLALTAFGDVWDALAARALDTGDRGLFAALKAERSRARFELVTVLAVVDRFRDAAAQIAPEVDLSEAAIRAAWDQAKAYRGLT